MEAYLKKSIFWLAVLAVAAVPLIVSTATLFPFLVGRQIFFQVLVTLMGLAYAGLVWKSPKAYLPPLNILTKAVYLFLGALILASLFSVDRGQSFWSTIERMDGLVHYLFWGFFFLIITAVFKTKEDWQNMLKALVVSGLVVSVYALGQELGFPGIFPALDPSRIFGSLGNPTFLAAILIFQPFLSGLLWFWNQSLAWRSLALVNAAGAFYFIGFSGTRGAMLGLGAAAVFLLAALAVCWWRQNRRALGAGLAVLLLAGIIGAVFLSASGGSFLPQGIQKLFRIEALASSLESRTLNWQIAVSAWQEKPILGWGPATYRYIYGEFYNPQLLSVTDKWLEKAHNQPLEFLATAGLIGLMAYLAVFAAVFWLLARSRAKEPALFVSFTALFIAYFVQNFFLFDTPSTLVYLAAVLGLVSILALPKEAPADLKAKRLKLIRIFGLLAVGLLVVSLPWTTWQPWRAAKLGGLVLQRQLQGNGEQIFNLYQKGFALDTYVSEKLLREGQLYITGLLNARQVSPEHPLVELFIKEHQKYLAAHPLSFRRRLGLGFIYLSAARTDPNFYPKAQETFQKAQQLAPRRPDALLALAEVYSGRGDFQGALSQIETALKLNPDYSRALWIKAQFLAAGGKKDLALKVIRQVSVRSLQWRQVYALRNLDRPGWQELKEFFEAEPGRFSSQVDYNLALAVIYQHLGEPQKAQELAQQAVNLKPAWQYSEIQLIQQMLRLKPEK